ncbi:MAG TPA: ArsR family transcriptional regulator [Kiritimatiellia bacterium]|nr:ArsR family transcriptional regulator [Kiritimatiellia bacterium]
MLDDYFHTLQSVIMKYNTLSGLHPTLWRTCRALANERRLDILRLLIAREPLTVSDVAREMDISMATASQYLRSLNARGLLTVMRKKRFVYYTVGADSSLPHAAALLGSVMQSLRVKQNTAGVFMQALTAFTHPRRVQLVKLLAGKPMGVLELLGATGYSLPALSRHLSKLQRRGIVRRRHRKYECMRPSDPLSKTLILLARQDSA